MMYINTINKYLIFDENNPRPLPTFGLRVPRARTRHDDGCEAVARHVRRRGGPPAVVAVDRRFGYGREKSLVYNYCKKIAGRLIRFTRRVTRYRDVI